MHTDTAPAPAPRPEIGTPFVPMDGAGIWKVTSVRRSIGGGEVRVYGTPAEAYDTCKADGRKLTALGNWSLDKFATFPRP